MRLTNSPDEQALTHEVLRWKSAAQDELASRLQVTLVSQQHRGLVSSIEVCCWLTKVMFVCVVVEAEADKRSVKLTKPLCC